MEMEKKTAEALKALAEAMDRNQCYACAHEFVEIVNDFGSNILLEAAYLLEKQDAEGNKWIKCSDGMPEERDTIFAKLKGTDKWKPAMFEKMSEDVRVVVVFEDGTRRVHHSYTVDGKWDVEKKPPKRTVTHWMPNPKLPKEGD